MKTKVFNETFKGHPIFAIYFVDDLGNKLEPDKGPYISFGAKKATVLMDHADDLKKFVEANTVNLPTQNPALDLTKLTLEQQAAIAAILGNK